MLGLTIKRPETAPKEDESFKSARPQLPESPDAERLGHVTPPIVDHTPAKPVTEQAIENAKAKGNDRLAELLAKAEEQARAQAKVIEREYRTSTNAAPRKQKSKGTKEVYTAPQVLFTEADICSDEEFIKRTLGANLHDAEMKRLFFANGGDKYINGTGLLYAVAFDLMRREKQTAIRIKQNLLKVDVNETWSRAGKLPLQHKVYVAGMPTVEQLVAREHAEEAAKERDREASWLASND